MRSASPAADPQQPICPEAAVNVLGVRRGAAGALGRPVVCVADGRGNVPADRFAVADVTRVRIHCATDGDAAAVETPRAGVRPVAGGRMAVPADPRVAFDAQRRGRFKVHTAALQKHSVTLSRGEVIVVVRGNDHISAAAVRHRFDYVGIASLQIRRSGLRLGVSRRLGNALAPRVMSGFIGGPAIARVAALLSEVLCVLLDGLPRVDAADVQNTLTVDVHISLSAAGLACRLADRAARLADIVVGHKTCRAALAYTRGPVLLPARHARAARRGEVRALADQTGVFARCCGLLRVRWAEGTAGDTAAIVALMAGRVA